MLSSVAVSPPKRPEGTIRAVIEGAIRERGSKTFLIAPESGRQRTFADLAATARSVHRYLSEIGVSKGEKVALLLENGIFTAEIFLGLMHGGFVPVPINVIAGPSEWQTILDHSGAAAIVVSREWRASLESVIRRIAGGIQIIEADPDDGFGRAGEGPPPSASPMIEGEEEALLAYTSGSTGEPKGDAARPVIVCAAALSHERAGGDASLVTPFRWIGGYAPKISGQLVLELGDRLGMHLDRTGADDHRAVDRGRWMPSTRAQVPVRPVLLSSTGARPAPPI
ncbi:acyl--CoA ligase [Candidatus Sumerlaeota bacterium]|nr:acyl--CoA ligase [Candidatus Sumerlaeota bacterium]